ncbi:MAG: Gram-negative bacterial tonB protein [Syntrophorhabdaceae bacterium PtaU1.Bin034]|nr:MAG: Gram-negative bacterial tonB protein [Syntrophorhabdaceae bacterium PtaU1.Bin034]
MLISVAVHSCVILLLVAASYAVENRPVRVVEVDFSLIKDQVREHPAPEVKKKVRKSTPRISGGGAAPKRMEEPAGPSRRNPETVPVKEQAEPPPVPTTVTASDTQSETAVHGTAATYADSSGSTSSLQPHSGAGDGISVGGPRGGGGGGNGQGGGRGSGSGQGAGAGLAEGGRDYNYIRDAVMKHVRYPEEAIRMGIEGRVLLSFIVLENGTTSRIRVVTGSGCALLDQSAKEAVAMTRIHRKVPYRVVVHLPITYRLQG